MTQPVFAPMKRLTWVALIALGILFGSQVIPGQATPQAALMTPTVVQTVFDVNCISLPVVTTTYEKLTDLGTFSIQSGDSMVEATFNGRIFVDSFANSTGAVFELRVDDLPSGVGRARANLRTAEAGGGGRPVSITGFFTGLPAGEHTASMWVRTFYGSANIAMVDPGCWSTDVLIVKEYTPFGFTYLPSLMSD